jgi:hypothetical protein
VTVRGGYVRGNPHGPVPISDVISQFREILSYGLQLTKDSHELFTVRAGSSLMR